MKKFQTGKVIAISLSHFFHDVYSAFLAPMLPLLIAKLGISLSLAGMLDVIRKVPALLNPFLGLIADKTGVKYFVILTPGITAIAMSLLGNSPSYIVLFILLFIAGISSTLFHVPSPVMIRNFSGTRTGTGMSFFMFGGEMARTVGPLIIIGAISLWGLEGTYRVMPLGILVSVILYFRLKDASSLKNINRRKINKGARETLRGLSSLFVSLTGFQLFRAGMKAALTLYLPTFLTSQGYSLWIAGIALSILQFAGAGGTFGTGFISDRIGHRNTLLITAIASPIAMGLFLSGSEIVMIPLLIILGFFLFASGPVMLALVQETDTERPAFVNSIYMTINFAISSLMVLGIGFLGDSIGLVMTYKICAILAFFSIPFVFLLPGKSSKGRKILE